MNRQHFDKYNNLGLNILYFRRKQGITQMSLAEMIDVSRAHMGKIETAQVGASLDVVFNIADALNIPVCKLFEIKE